MSFTKWVEKRSAEKFPVEVTYLTELDGKTIESFDITFTEQKTNVVATGTILVSGSKVTTDTKISFRVQAGLDSKNYVGNISLTLSDDSVYNDTIFLKVYDGYRTTVVKNPQEIAPIESNFLNRKPAEELTIEDVTITITQKGQDVTNTILVPDSIVIVNDKVKAKIQAGTDKKMYLISILVELSDGSLLEDAAILYVSEVR